MSRNPVPDPAEYSETPESRDLALLSAYLDEVLTVEARAALDQRLRAEPALQANLSSLRQTQAILRAAPVLTVPRDFVLDPAVYGRGSQLRVQQRPVRLFGALGSVAAIAAALIIAFGITSANRQPTSQNTILVASNPTFAGSPDHQQAAKTDQLSSTATFTGVLSDNGGQLQASSAPTLIRSATPIPVSPKPVVLKTQPPPTIIAASPPPATASPTPVATAAQQSGSAASSGQAGASGGQDAIGSTQPNLSAPVAPGAPPSAANGGLGPVAPSLLIAPTATLRQAAIAPTSAPTSAKAIPSAQPPSAANQPAPVVVNLPTLLRIIWWLLITLFTGKGLS